MANPSGEPAVAPTSKKRKKGSGYTPKLTKAQFASYYFADFLDATPSVLVSKFAARRLPELKSLWSSHLSKRRLKNVSPVNKESAEYRSDGGKRSDRHLRRRGKSHNPRRRHRHPRGIVGENGIDARTAPDGVVGSRRARRKPSSLMERHTRWKGSKIEGVPPGRRPDNWQETHIWHAKRFHTTVLDDWSVPVMHSGRGSRAALRFPCTVRDGTCAEQPVEIGSSDQEALGRVMRSILDPLGGDGVVWDDDNDDGAEVMMKLGEGILHLAGQYPDGALGPVRFIPGRRNEEGGGVYYYIWILVHPSFLSKTEDLIKDAISSNKIITVQGPHLVENGVSLLRLRGADSTQVMTRVLSPCHNLADTTLTLAPHGTIFPSTLSIPNNTQSIQCLLISTKPNNHNLKINHPVSGWDILILPNHTHLTKSCFFALEQAGPACAIGLLEEAHFKSQAEPPLPVFPRDYPDTPQGRQYWGNEGDAGRLRRIFEKGGERWGRRCGYVVKRCERERQEHIYTHKTNNTIYDKNDPFHWTDLMDSNHNEDTLNVLVVRGTTFGTPFLHALEGSIKSHTLIQNKHCTKRRRPRRPVKNPTKPINAQTRPNNLPMLRNMIASLSLPALLRCSLQIEGAGALAPMAAILQYGEPPESNTNLGMVVWASFSPNRGTVHGVGFVSGKLMLKAIASTLEDENKYLVVGNGGVKGGKKRVELRVLVTNENPGSLPRIASLCILL